MKICHREHKSLLNLIIEKKIVEHPLMMITTHKRHNLPLKEIKSKYWLILDRSSATRTLVNNDIMVTLRKPKSNRDIF